MRVVSLVPSWTETLLECGVNVVGRTRFCIHPGDSIKNISVVGGTKDLDRAIVESLSPDLLIVDKEENLPWMANAKGAPWRVFCSHVASAESVPLELEKMGDLLGNERLKSMAASWRAVLAKPRADHRAVSELPGVLEWLRKPDLEPDLILYLIWRDPWMAIAENTFIGSMLTHFGFGNRLPHFSTKYPKLDLGNYDPAKTLLLFSSEPFPFVKKRDELLRLGFPCALVNGESYSWFGARALRFLITDTSKP